ncbi:trypsin-like peptidase domain-containing protein [Azospirillum palustre]
MDIPDYTSLTPDDIDALSDALLSAVTKSDDLERIVFHSTGDRLYVEYVGEGKPLRATVDGLLRALEERQTTPLLLRRLLKERPNRRDLHDLVARLCPPVVLVPPPSVPVSLAAQRGGVPQPRASSDAWAPGLERNVRPHLHSVDVRVWMARFDRMLDRVCRVEVQGFAAGTGFLIGPDLVLTNYHVVEQCLDTAGSLDRIACRFDYAVLPDGTWGTGRTVKVVDCLDTSFYSPAEARNEPDHTPPTADELDYALVRLDSRIGDEPNQAGSALRGWIALREDAPVPGIGAPLLILQHPEGSPMKLALDTQAILPSGNAMRIRYATNTEPGSSGAPCFTMDWELVALHHYGDSAWLQPKFNQGVPIGLIRKRIVERGFSHHLGA